MSSVPTSLSRLWKPLHNLGRLDPFRMIHGCSVQVALYRRWQFKTHTDTFSALSCNCENSLVCDSCSILGTEKTTTSRFSNYIPVQLCVDCVTLSNATATTLCNKHPVWCFLSMWRYLLGSVGMTCTCSVFLGSVTSTSSHNSWPPPQCFTYTHINLCVHIHYTQTVHRSTQAQLYRAIKNRALVQMCSTFCGIWECRCWISI